MPLFVAPLFFLFFLFSSFFFPPLSRKESKSKKYVALVDQRRFPLKSRLFFEGEEEEEEEEKTKASPNKSSPRKRGKSYARRGMERKEGRKGGFDGRESGVTGLRDAKKVSSPF